ncbi:MAG TPA: hypothetical protein DCQ31_15990, partial [Bacteroidales bacterium]|nr:hypothetical protein [Bacteroidales bacterium]
KKEEFLREKTSFEYIDIQYNKKQIALTENSIGFTYCQTPVVYQISDKKQLEVKLSNGSLQRFTDLYLNEEISRKIFERTGEIEQITVWLTESELR